MKYLFILGLSLSLIACARQESTAPNANLEDLHGQWVVINYWAQWCKPCIKEIPELNELDQRYDQVTVLGVNYDGASGVELEQQRQQLGVAFGSLQQDPATQLGTTRPVVLPTTLVVDTTGKLVATLVGPQTAESLAKATQQLAAEGSE
ncbi:MAG: TlpA disulfide reductase family protein [Halioglobus sp.]